MTPLEDWTKQIQDALADNSALREGLHDEEATSLMDWGARQAERLSVRMAVPGAPEPDEEHVANTAYSLARLMTRVTWLAVYRHKKDAAWLTRTFFTLNQLNRELFGPDAPVFSDEEIATWIATHAQHNNADLVRSLIAHLSPAPEPPAEAAPPDEPPPDPGPELDSPNPASLAAFFDDSAWLPGESIE